jgi:uncharacterized membrane protein
LISNSRNAFVLALLLAVVFLAVQLHCCADLTTQSLDSHVCPVCSTVAAAIAIYCLIFFFVLDSRRFEVLYALPSLPHVILRSTTPRAPPLLA